MRIGLITLGCDKNTVDNEYLAGLLEDRGCDVTFSDLEHLDPTMDAVVVTTCGFIGDAKAQSVETLAWLAESQKATGRPTRIFAAGCLAQRYAQDLASELPELSGIVGVGQYAQLVDLILSSNGKQVAVSAQPAVEIEGFMRRKRSDDMPYAFLKISDGCNHGCTFCSIPIMKGKHRSVPPDVLLQEAQSLIDQGARELVLVAQDLADYGKDRGRDWRLPRLLRELAQLTGDYWLRCMYCYPMGVTDALLDVLANESKIVPYLDVPLQHLDPEVLRRMKRPAREVDTAQMVRRLRDAVPDIALRTTMIVGFPGESPAAHRRMLDGMQSLRFDWLGAFQYSKEEDPPAASAERQVGKAVKEKRWKAVMETQALITRERLESRIDRDLPILVERFDAEQGLWVGRSPYEALEIDGNVFIEGARSDSLRAGQFVTARVTRALDYDLMASVAPSA